MATETSLQAPPKTPAADNSPQGWLQRKLSQLGNNVRLIDLYRSQKDYYKLLEMIGPVLGSVLPWNKFSGNKPRHVLQDEIERLDKAEGAKLDYLKRSDRNLASHEYANLEQEAVAANRTFNHAKTAIEPKLALQRLNNGLWGDTLNFFLQTAISKFSSWWEKGMVVRTYEDLVRTEFDLSGAVTFKDLQKSKNPIVQEATHYYSRKALIRALPDLTGLIRWIPKLYYLLQGKAPSNSTNASGLDKLMYNLSENVDGMKMLLGMKTIFFSWYFFERETGSFYEAQNLWNKTEGIKNLPNRGLNQNVQPGEFVRWQEIRTLYERFREEQPKMGLAEFTTHDPLTTRVFEQVARYLNFHYMRDIFEMAEKSKQDNLKGTRFTHAMLIDLVGNGGLNVDDAIGSAIRLEIMAHYGAEKQSLGMQKFREAQSMIAKIKRPKLNDYATPEQGAEALHSYFVQMNSIAELFLGDAWPSRYFEEEIKPGYIKYFFKNNPPADKIDYLMNAMAVHKSEAPTHQKNWSQDHVTEAPLAQKFEPTARHTDHAIPTASGVQALGA